MVEGLASVIIAKTTMTIAEVLFILLGITLGVRLLGGNDSSGQAVAAALSGVTPGIRDCGVCVRTAARALYVVV